ncbi:MAG: sigma-70 family RNA polymerase sigma factor [Clostridia bacterium]|nr:sigma-70 family RNA polymerase sigma factor [Clostridia bacterium]
MKKEELPKLLNRSFLDDLYGYCYRRTSDSHEAEELCSEIVFAIVKAGNRESEIADAVSFAWKIAHNVYADYAKRRRVRSERMISDDPHEILINIAEEDDSEQRREDGERLQQVLREISFLSRAYRRVMIWYYLDGLPIAEIASRLGITQNTVRQRMFSARNTIRKEVTNMDYNQKKPVGLQDVDLCIIGTGSPAWGDPREVCDRLLSRHVVWLCRKKPMSAAEISKELNMPMAYVEEELEIQSKGRNGQYGMLRKTESGRYAINFALLDEKEITRVREIYASYLPSVCDRIASYIEAHKEEYLAFPYLNHRVDLNLILWQQVFNMASRFESKVKDALQTTCFADALKADRPFSVFGYRVIPGERSWGCGCDGINAYNICGYENVRLTNIYITRIRKHFSCGWDISRDGAIQMAIRAVNGLPVSSLSEKEKESAAKAVECGYLLREGEMLYTKILTLDATYEECLFDITKGLDEVFREDAARVAEEMAVAIREILPEYLMSDWWLVNMLANQPMFDTLVEALIGRGLLTPPEDGIGAEGCWMILKK